MTSTRKDQSPAHDSGKPHDSSGCLLDIAAVAERLGVTERFVRRLVEERRMPFHKIGKFVRFDPSDINEWVNEQRVAQLNDH